MCVTTFQNFAKHSHEFRFAQDVGRAWASTLLHITQQRKEELKEHAETKQHMTIIHHRNALINLQEMTYKI